MNGAIQSRMINAQRAAELLGVPVEKIVEWIASGDIPSVSASDGPRVQETEIMSDEVRSWFQRGCELSVSPDTVDEAAASFRAAVSLNPRFNLA